LENLGKREKSVLDDVEYRCVLRAGLIASGIIDGVGMGTC
jgi:hypothetical protein